MDCRRWPGLVTIGETEAEGIRTMSLDADLIVDRRRMRRKLTFWRVLAVLFIAVIVVGVAAFLQQSLRTCRSLTSRGSLFKG